jgi:hypothetical protein
MKYPTIKEINKANKEQLEDWWKNLPSPTNMNEQNKIQEIKARKEKEK